MEKILLFFNRLKIYFWSKTVSFTRNNSFYPLIYKSYWHYRFFKNQQKQSVTSYFSARPNPGAGIGHQIANWIAGYWFAKQFGLRFAHIPFSNQSWEKFLGFGEKEDNLTTLIGQGYKTVKLPLFDEFNNSEVDLVKKIINSYSDQKVVFIAEQDQNYRDQFGAIDEIKDKFKIASIEQSEKVIYDKDSFNIAVHVRRTVVIDNKVIYEDDSAKEMRWLSNDYYEKVLKQVLDNLNINKRITIYIFSTSRSDEFAEFSKYGDVRFCTDMDEYSSFLHLTRADLLVTSKSSFSYNPALLNEAIKICPRNFWHGYPTTKNWILVENDGSFDSTLLNQWSWER